MQITSSAAENIEPEIILNGNKIDRVNNFNFARINNQ